MITVFEFAQAMNWEDVDTWHPSLGSVGNSKIEKVEGDWRCQDHDTCYETHDTMWVFKVGTQYFGRKAQYSSYAGLQWAGDVFEVQPVKVVKAEWATVEPVLPQPPFTAAQVEKAIEDLFLLDEEDDGAMSLQYGGGQYCSDKVTVTSWSDFTESVESGTTWVPALGNLPIQHVPTGGVDMLSSGLRCTFKVGDQTFQKRGTWVSHSGAHWNGALVQVEIREKTVQYWHDL